MIIEYLGLDKFLEIYSVLNKAGCTQGSTLILGGNGWNKPSSNPGWDCLHFPLTLIPLEKTWISLFFPSDE